jgi:antitoxin component YwqK of YwqJK toxin-antitoxin module
VKLFTSGQPQEVQFYTDGKLTGTVVYDSTGKISTSSGWIPDGKVNEYIDGKLAVEAFYKNGMREGPVRMYRYDSAGNIK